MMQYAKIIELLNQNQEKLAINVTPSLEFLRPIIEKMAQDAHFMQVISRDESMPFCVENVLFNKIKMVDPYQKAYVAFGIDGSQIYPDRHAGIHCFLLHIGSITIEYGSLQGFVEKKSEPFLFLEWNTWNDAVHAHEIVDTERFLKELEVGFERANEYKQKNPNDKIIVFIDGPLLFWHCAQKPASFQKEYGIQYGKILQLFESAAIPVVGYTSMPRSREFVKIVKKYIEYAKITDTNVIDLCSNLTDTQLISLFLKSGQRTPLFKSVAPVQLNEQEIHFSYINTGSEYVRIEMPAWMNKDQEIISFAYEATMHQIQNGFGYPTVLALAHEQAVVKNIDRIFFTKILHKVIHENEVSIGISQKQSKKDFGNLIK